jgi:hypothetical protein
MKSSAPSTACFRASEPPRANWYFDAVLQPLRAA